MKKKIGSNVSSGAEKVETVEKKIAPQEADANVNAPKTRAKKPAAKTASVKKTTKKALSAEEKKERAAAEKRVNKAKAKAEKKQQRAEKRAAVKEKKIEKRAEIKKKKLARRELIAKKRAERKQAKIDRRAALKEKKLERRAEKIARREMLKNETKTEREKRIAREKKERAALKKQRAADRRKAREDRQKARSAAHARRAADKKHRREQKTERKENRRGFGGWLAAVISLGVACLALATIVTYGAFEMNGMQVASENGYRSTLYEMVSVSEDMDNNLSKLRVAAGADEQRRLLTDVLVDTALMESALERIPVDQATSTDISSFVNRTGRYAGMLLKRLAAGEPLTESQLAMAEKLYAINAQLYGELNELATHLDAGDFTDFVNGNAGEISQRFGEMGQKTHEGSEELFRAPFEGKGNVGKNRLAGLDEITSSEAKGVVESVLAAYRFTEVEYTGETTSPMMTCYNFTMRDENGVEYFAEVTKNGGKLAFFDAYEECSEKNFDLETCDKLARGFLEELGIGNVEAVWLSDSGMVADLTYTSCDGGVRGYPDLIRVRVCESKGRVMGIDARAYLVNYHERTFGAELTEKEAQSLLSPALEVTAVNRAIIPAGGSETACYEFACKYGEDEYLVYLDARSGEEVQLYRVVKSARGNYLE